MSNWADINMLLFPIIINPNQVTYQFYLYTKLKAYLTAHIIKACLLVTWPINLWVQGKISLWNCNWFEHFFLKHVQHLHSLSSPFLGEAGHAATIHLQTTTFLNTGQYGREEFLLLVHSRVSSTLAITGDLKDHLPLKLNPPCESKVSAITGLT